MEAHCPKTLLWAPPASSPSPRMARRWPGGDLFGASKEHDSLAQIFGLQVPVLPLGYVSGMLASKLKLRHISFPIPSPSHPPGPAAAGERCWREAAPLSRPPAATSPARASSQGLCTTVPSCPHSHRAQGRTETKGKRLIALPAWRYIHRYPRRALADLER